MPPRGTQEEGGDTQGRVRGQAPDRGRQAWPALTCGGQRRVASSSWRPPHPQLSSARAEKLLAAEGRASVTRPGCEELPGPRGDIGTAVGRLTSGAWQPGDLLDQGGADARITPGPRSGERPLQTFLPPPGGQSSGTEALQGPRAELGVLRLQRYARPCVSEQPLPVGSLSPPASALCSPQL